MIVFKNKLLFLVLISSLVLISWYENRIIQMEYFYEDQVIHKKRQLSYANIEIDSLYQQLQKYQNKVYLKHLTPIPNQINVFDTMKAMAKMFKETGNCEVHFHTVKN